MKTKTIFKALALAMMMPAMLLTTACSSDDDAVENENNKKGYPLQVTVNVTREGDGTRATYNESTKKLAFSEGDQLFVSGNAYGTAGKFAGTLTMVSEGTFSGTIYTKNPYDGTFDALFTAGSAKATLLPAGYDTYNYLTIQESGTYDAYIQKVNTKPFATSKATALEQFSAEYGSYTSGTGFTLSPLNGILNFTIAGLSASTNVPVTFTDDSSNKISENVTTDASGNATFAIGVQYYTDLYDCSLTVGGNPITLVSSSKYVEDGKIYNINRVIWDFSQLSDPADLFTGYENGGVTLQGDGSLFFDTGNLTGNCTFTAPSGKKFTSIVITADAGEIVEIFGFDFDYSSGTATWSGSSTSVSFSEANANGITSIVFTLANSND